MPPRFLCVAPCAGYKPKSHGHSLIGDTFMPGGEVMSVRFGLFFVRQVAVV
jgi:hypothetical protein